MVGGMDGLTDRDVESFERLVTAEMCERSLFEFYKRAWPHFDSSRYVYGWHLEAICDHLEAVTAGHIKRLLINVPPRHSKTSAVAIAWPAWTWARATDTMYPLQGPGVRFLCAAYNATKAQADGVTARRLIGSTWYQRLWGERVVITADRDNQEQYDTTAGGSRISTGIPESLGKGGSIRIIDDPHKTDDVESATTIERQIRAYNEVWKTRSNDPKFGAEVIIMQRLSQADLSGVVLGEGDVVHLMLPLEYEPTRHCVTAIGYEDPRGLDVETGERLEGLDEATGKVELGSPIAKQAGAILWPERYDENWVRRQADGVTGVGPFAYSSQYQQIPVPRGGGLIEREWWKLWEPRQYPDFGQLVASLDGAYTENQMNDPSALTVWGSYPDPQTGGPRIMLRHAWQAHLMIDKLIERVAETCKALKVDVLLIEGKASGISVAQEIRRIYGQRKWQTIVIQPKGDKYERLMQVAPLFANGLIYAPDRDWVDMVIDQITLFPRAKHDDLADSTSQALYWLRQHGVVMRREEYDEEVEEAKRYKKPVPVLYDV